MVAERTRAAYWTSGGTIMSRGGPLSLIRSITLLQFYGLQACRCAEAADRPGARHCAELALELAHAMIAADDWRCAALGVARSPATPSRASPGDLGAPA